MMAIAGCSQVGQQPGKPTAGSEKFFPAKAGNQVNNPAAPAASAQPLWTNYEINSSVHAIAFKGGDVWVGTESGLIRYNQAKDQVVAHYGAENGLFSNNITSLDPAPGGGLWVGTHGGGLTLIDAKGDWHHYSVPQLGDSFVYQVLEDVRGNGFWVATWSGLSHYNGGGWHTYTKADGLVDDWVYALAQDADGTLWVGTEGGVSVFNGTTWTTYTHAQGLGADQAKIGAYEVIGNPSHHHQAAPGKSAEGYNPNYVLSAALDGAGNRWFGTWGAGLSRFDGRSWVTYTKADGLGGNFVTDLYVAPDGILWAATDGGVSLFRDGRWKTMGTHDGMISDEIFSISVDSSGRKWFGTMDGVSRLDGFMDPSHSAPPGGAA